MTLLNGRVLPGFTRARVRVLPLPTQRDAPVLVNLCLTEQRRQLTLPSTFGFPDPVWEARHLLRERGPDLMIWSRVYLPVLVREFRAARASDQDITINPHRPYVLSLPMMLADQLMEVVEETIHETPDATITRSGRGIETRYHTDFEPLTPACAPDLQDTLDAECADFDAADYVPTFNRRRYEALMRSAFDPR